MKKDNETLERLVAIGLVAIGCLTKEYILVCIGVIYFIAKM